MMDILHLWCYFRLSFLLVILSPPVSEDLSWYSHWYMTCIYRQANLQLVFLLTSPLTPPPSSVATCLSVMVSSLNYQLPLRVFKLCLCLCRDLMLLAFFSSIYVFHLLLSLKLCNGSFFHFLKLSSGWCDCKWCLALLVAFWRSRSEQGQKRCIISTESTTPLG